MRRLSTRKHVRIIHCQLTAHAASQQQNNDPFALSRSQLEPTSTTVVLNEANSSMHGSETTCPIGGQNTKDVANCHEPSCTGTHVK